MGPLATFILTYFNAPTQENGFELKTASFQNAVEYCGTELGGGLTIADIGLIITADCFVFGHEEVNEIENKLKNVFYFCPSEMPANYVQSSVLPNLQKVATHVHVFFSKNEDQNEAQSNDNVTYHELKNSHYVSENPQEGELLMTAGIYSEIMNVNEGNNAFDIQEGEIQVVRPKESLFPIPLAFTNPVQENTSFVGLL